MYELFEHEADVGIRGIGKTLEKAFEEAAKALFSVEVDIKKVKARKTVKVSCEAENIEELFVEWLNALLTKASITDMVFSQFNVKIEKKKDGFKLEGTAKGEKINPRKHGTKDEVKGATYAELKVYQDKKKRWIAQCIVDV